MVSLLKLGEISVDVEFKDIKNVHLSVYPPTGRVRFAAPSRMKLETVRVFAISKLAWIKQQQNKLRQQERETPREYLDRESHYLWGKRYLLKVVESDAPPSLELKHSRMLLRVRPGTNDDKKQAVMEEWYRTQLKNTVALMLQKWETRIGVNVERVFVQRMKTKWGSCCTWGQRPDSSLPVFRYVLYYRPNDYGIELVRVLHGSRDVNLIF